jgi:hypothetical protein
MILEVSRTMNINQDLAKLGHRSVSRKTGDVCSLNHIHRSVSRKT